MQSNDRREWLRWFTQSLTGAGRIGAMIGAVVLTTSLTLHAKQALDGSKALPLCDEKYFAPTKWYSDLPTHCEPFWKKHQAIYKTFADGSVLPNGRLLTEVAHGPLTDENKSLQKKLEAAEVPSPAKIIAIKKLFENLRRLLIDEIQAGADAEALTPMQKFLTQRISNLTLNIPSQRKDCDRIEPNAFFFFDSQSIDVCRSISGFPIEALLTDLAHEIMHATDPCAFENLTIDDAFLEQIKAGHLNALKACGISDTNATSVVSELTGRESNKLTADQNIAQVLYSCGLAKFNSASVKAKDLKDFPKVSLYTCTDDWVADETYGDRVKTKSDEVQGWLKDGGSSLMIKAIPIDIAAHLHCSTQAQEAYADHAGARLIDDYLARFGSQLTQDGKHEMLFNMDLLHCMYPQDPLEGYPLSTDRALAYLQYPSIQAAIGCQGLSHTVRCSAPANGTAKATPAPANKRSPSNKSAPPKSGN